MGAEWIDLVDPTREEILHAIAVPLDPEAIEALVAVAHDGRDARPLLESHGAYMLGVLTVPRSYPERDHVSYLEVDVVAAPRRVVTVRKSGRGGELVSLDAVAARAQGGATAGELVHTLVDTVADAMIALLDDLYGEIDELEDSVDELPGAAARRRLAELRHELYHARRTVSATRAAVRRVADGRIEVGGGALFPQPLELAFVDTYDTLVRATEELDVARDLLASVRDYVQAKIAEGQNEVAKKLTVIASLVLVPSLIVGFYGQNFEGAFDDAYWSVGVSLGLIGVTSIVQLALFRWRRWV